MADSQHIAASHHLPGFITAPGQTDTLFVFTTCFIIAALVLLGVAFFWIHSLPERMMHKSGKAHFDIVAALGLLSLFTHIHAFWVAALLLALVKFPDFHLPHFASSLKRIAAALEKMTGAPPKAPPAQAPNPAPVAAVPAAASAVKEG